MLRSTFRDFLPPRAVVAVLAALLGWVATAVPFLAAAEGPQAAGAPGVGLSASGQAARGNMHRRSSQPNVILLAADGWSEADVDHPGTRPHLEKLAASGARWTRAYAGAASTPASRAALLTGRHSGHGRLRGSSPPPLANEDITLGEVFRAAGYRTAAVGVWDLGGNDTSGHPLKQGFADWFGFLDSKEARDLHPKSLWRNTDIFDNLIDAQGRLANYAPDWFARFATNYVQVHEDHPFFLYVAHPLPGSAGSRETREQHLRLWDRLVGSVVRELERGRILRDTILVVTSTGGGGPGEDRLSEGRLRVPLWVSWPGKIPAGRVQDRPVALWDVLPTVAALARVRAPADLDGISLAPELLGGRDPLPRAGGLYWETAEAMPRRAILWEHWKAVERPPAGAVELFDLQADPATLKDLAESQPERLSEARRRLREAADPLPSTHP